MRLISNLQDVYFFNKSKEKSWKFEKVYRGKKGPKIQLNVAFQEFHLLFHHTFFVTEYSHNLLVIVEIIDFHFHSMESFLFSQPHTLEVMNDMKAEL